MDKEKVIETFKERICTCSMIDDGFDVTINWRLADDILAMLKEQEAVVRCCDCEHWDSQCHSCEHFDGIMQPDFYCADGVKKHDR